MLSIPVHVFSVPSINIVATTVQEPALCYLICEHINNIAICTETNIEL